MPFFRKIIVLSLVTYYACPVFGQAYFAAPDTLCINDSLIIENQSREASSYYWNFCTGNLAYEPTSENLGNLGELNGPAFIDFAKDGNDYFAFITNSGTLADFSPSLTRLHYGNDILSTPQAENLDRINKAFPKHVQGVQIVQENGNWYVFVVGELGEASRLVRIDFGSSLTNDPQEVTNFGNIGEMDYPFDLYIDNIDGEWIGFTVNGTSNTITCFTFPNGIAGVPEGVNLGNLAGFDYPCGILPIKEDGAWYLFITNRLSNDISRLDFGNSLFNTPSGTSVGDAGYLDYPFDMTIIRDCEHTYGFVLNRHSDIIRLEFENGLGAQPTYTSLGELDGFNGPQGISDVFRVGDDLYAYIVNIDGSTITRMRFVGCDNASPASSTKRNPPPVTYNATGTYNVNLVIDEGTAQQENYCVEIVVVDSAFVRLGNDTIIPAGNSVELQPDAEFPAYEWSTGLTDKNITVYQAGIYSITVTNMYGCQATDEQEVLLDIGIPNFFTPNGDGYNDTWSIPFFYNEPSADIQVFDRFGNLLVHYKSGDGEWDGTSGGRLLPTGTYWYIINISDMQKPYKGSVSIKR